MGFQNLMKKYFVMSIVTMKWKICFLFFFLYFSFIACLGANAFKPVKIACIAAVTGIAAEDNLPMIQSAEMTIDEINRKGGLLGESVKLIIIDNKSTSLGSKSAAEKAVKLNVTGVIGAAWSSHSLAMAPVLQKAKIPMITPISTNPEVTKIGNYIFRVCFTDDFQGKVMAEFARETLKAGAAAVLQNINEQYSITLSNFFMLAFVKSGGKILLKGNYTANTVDFTNIFIKIKRLNPDVIFIPGYSRDSGLAIRQARNMGVKSTFLGGDAWSSTKISDYAGESLNGSYAVVPWNKDSNLPQSRHLKKIFFNRFKRPVDHGVIALTYDAVNVFAEAVKKAGTLDRKRIRDALARTIDFKGATGDISFDGQGDPIGKKVDIVKFENKKSVSVKSISEKIIKIAAIYSLTGKAAASQKPSLEGVMAAVNDLNESGGITGKKIKLYVIDNKSSPIGSKIAAEKAAKKNVAAIIGSDWSSHSIAVARIAQLHKIPMISNISTNPEVTKIGNYIFRVCFTDDFQGKVMANFAIRDLKASTAVVFTNITSDYSMGLSREFQKNFEISGGKILFTAFYKPKLRNYAALISQAKKMNPDVIFFSGHDESGFLAEKAQAAGIKAVLLGGDDWGYKSFLDKGGKHIKRGFFCTHWSEKSKNSVSLAFVKKYRDNSNLSSAFALSHDAVFLLADAIKRSHSVDRKKIRAAIENTELFRGVTGNISFNKNGDPVKDAVINEISNGKIRYLKTIKYKAAMMRSCIDRNQK